MAYSYGDCGDWSQDTDNKEELRERCGTLYQLSLLPMSNSNLYHRLFPVVNDILDQLEVAQMYPKYHISKEKT